jgi:hypothetical protein
LTLVDALDPGQPREACTGKNVAAIGHPADSARAIAALE